MTEIGNENLQGVQGETTLEQSHERTPEEIQHDHEKQAFETHINTSEEAVPDNFKDAGSWFDSLKESQKQYTQSRQEIADLKAQINEPVKEEMPIIENPTELRIQQTPETLIDETTGTATIGVDEATYETWAMEFAASGSFSEETRTEIQSKTGFSDRMLNDFIEGQNAKLRESYRNASGVVGGREKLDKIFEWAAKNLSPDDMQSVNIGLASSTYEVTLRGLDSMYNNATKTEKAKEPTQNSKLTSVSASETGILPYSNKREFTAERNDQKFQLDAGYRDMVQRRMSITDWNTLPK